jgi:hypothetical protein
VNNYMATPSEIAFYNKGLWGAYTAGHLKETVYKECDFTADGVIQAHKDIESRQTTGKLLIKVGV